MEPPKKLSRRAFLNSTVALAPVLLGPVMWGSHSTLLQTPEEQISKIPRDSNSKNKLISGLLYSQIGYNLGETPKIIIRIPEKNLVPEHSVCKLIPKALETEYAVKLKYWGEIWQSHWWIAEFKDLNEEGEWSCVVEDTNSMTLFKGDGFRIEKEILWNSTYEWSSVDMLERRKHFTKVGAGWQDAGALWVESPAQSAMIICLTDLAQYDHENLDQPFQERIYEQITVGSDYLVMTQEKAHELGYDKGAMSHDLLGHEDFILPNDVAKAVVALYRSAMVLPEKYADKIKRYREVADLSLDWLLTKAKPMGSVSYNKVQRGLPEDTKIPEHEWLTRDLVFICWGAFERYQNGESEYKEICIDWADKIIRRQFSKAKPENGFYGHFKEFDSLPHSQNLWVHAIGGKQYGADAGGLFPNYLQPLIYMLQEWPEHKEAKRWKQALKDYAYGFLIPSCKLNPFYLVPNGIFGDEGPVWFAGPFHGMNAIYGYTAALAAQMSLLFNEPLLKEIAVGNLQWIAGLNAGVTKESLLGSVIYSEDIPEGIALPSSMICDIGNRTAGTWFKTRGVVCNGFSDGEQFKMDISPTKENDGPFSFTDEDWIPHSAGFLTGVMQLNKLN